MKQFAIAFLLAALLPSAASADTITFSTAIGGLFSGPVVEGDFSFTLFSGGLFLDPVNGDPDGVMQGGIAADGGTLQLIRVDVVGGLFTFDQASVHQFNFGAVPVAFEGYLGGALQATDSLVTSASNLAFTTIGSTNLTGVAIDELRVILDASNATTSYEGVDNIVVSKVPEPSSMLLIAAGLIGLSSRAQIRKRR